MYKKMYIGKKKFFGYRYGIAVSLFFMATMMNYIIILLSDKTMHVSGIYLLAVILTSLLTGSYICGMLSAVAGVIGTNFFTYPHFAIDFSLTGYPLTFLIMGAVAIGTCAMTVSIRKQRDEANLREHVAQRLNEMDRKLLQVDTKDELIRLLLEALYTQLNRTILYFEWNVEQQQLVYFNEIGEIQEKRKRQCKTELEDALIQKQMTSDKFFFKIGELMVCSSIAWQPQKYGIVSILTSKEAVEPILLQYIQGVVNHFAIAFSRQELREIQQKILIEKQAEETRGYLLRAISHDLRTPLTGILGASSVILENGEKMENAQKRRLVTDIHEEAQWLLRMIENVLSVTKIGNCAPELKKTLEPIEEVIADSVSHCKKHYPNIKVEIHLPKDFIMLPMDPILIRQVITNLIDNAYQHGSAKEVILLDVTMKEMYVKVAVTDSGEGMQKEQIDRIFYGKSSSQKKEKGDSNRGLGLGLAICRTIIEAHGGRIYAENCSPKGLKVIFLLPTEDEGAC